MSLLFSALAGLLLLQAPSAPLGGATATGAQPLSPEMRTIDVDERRGTVLDPELTFTDHTGRVVRLGDFFDGERPVILTLNYYRCRVICSVQLAGLAEALDGVDFGGEKFRVVTVGIDPRESAPEAATKRDSLFGQVTRQDLDWTLLTGTALAVQAMAAQLGVSFAYDAEQDQYAHPAVAVFLSPQGKIVQYVYGLAYEARDLKFGLMEAAEGKVGSPMEKIIMSCFHYDATIGRYGPFAMGIMRLGGILTVVVISAVLFVFWRRERRGAVGRSLEAVS